MPIYTILNKISIAVIVLVLSMFSVDMSFSGVNYWGSIPLICLVLVASYISKLEKKAEIDPKIKIISWVCFFATGVIGLVLILSFPEIFNTGDF